MDFVPFVLVFGDKASLGTHTPQLPSSEPTVDFIEWHWIVLRAKDWALPVRFGTLADFERFCRQETVEIYQAFSSLAELEIYCIGAAIQVPTLIRWRIRNEIRFRWGLWTFRFLGPC